MEYIMKQICKILQTQLSLTDEQIWTDKQRKNIPEESGPYFIVGSLGERNLGMPERYPNFETETSVKQKELHVVMFQVDLFSRSSYVKEICLQAVNALNSEFSQQLQGSHAFEIKQDSLSVVDTSSIEGIEGLSRYTIRFDVTYLTDTSKSIEKQ